MQKDSTINQEDNQKIVSKHFSSNDFLNAKNHDSLILSMLKSVVLWIFDSIQVIIIALAIFIVFYLYIVSPHTIEGTSMEPNFCNADFILADKLTPRFSGYKVGDVIVFQYDQNNDFIKRIIGASGDKITIKAGKVYRNGNLVHEDYLPEGRATNIRSTHSIKEGEEYTVPEGDFFVMGDNRDHSSDSREFLAINPNKNTIRGRALIVLWPFNRMRIFKDHAVQPVNECRIQ